MKRYLKQALSLCLALLLVCAATPFSPETEAASTTIYYESFDKSKTMPNGWTTYDADGDGYGWGMNTNVYNSYNRNGYCVYSTSALSSGVSLTPDDWMMMPALEIPDNPLADYQLSFQIYTSYMTGYSDYIQIYASETPLTAPTPETAGDLILDKRYYSGSQYQEMTADLSAYCGETVYLAFRHHTAKGVWQMFLDEVQVKAVEPDSYMVKVTGNTDAYTVIPATGSFKALADRDYAFTVDVNDAYENANGTLTVTANGIALTADENGNYVIPAVSKKQTLSIVYGYDTGDVNGDGAVTGRDALMLYSAASGRSSLNSVQEQAALIDVRDGATMTDALMLYSYTSGKRDYINVNEDLSLIWKSDYADTANGFASRYSVKKSAYYYNDKRNRDYAVNPASGDVKQLFSNERATRAVNLADGYVMTLPFTDMRPDYSLGEYRSTYENADSVLHVSRETKNPYGNTAGSWNTYLTEWVNRFVASDSFLAANEITRTRATTSSTSKLSGYTVLNYDLYIQNDDTIEKPYYNIAIVRKNSEYVEFFLLVMKSTTDQSAKMDTIVKSFKEIEIVGKAQNTQHTYAVDIPDYWNAETKAYYNKLLTQDSTDWGFFSASMASDGSSEYNRQDQLIQTAYDELSTAMDYDYEIMPTYLHIGWGSSLHTFPLTMAEKYAGGNGFNGKPVLQMSYQFTTSNNTQLDRYTPMFDVLRGEYDDHFRNVARSIKNYGKPVLFRLNNEMNTDWTSYAGIVTLLDPDIFAATWERMYEIFLQEGVDNCIWIFNPIADTTPYCNWGEHLCYLPDMDYVQAIGLTSYEMGNSSSMTSFSARYSALYEKNTPYFAEYPWIISEFACGAGGEKQYDWGSSSWKTTTKGRYVAMQTAWVNEMFDAFSHRTEPGYEYVDRIKGAVWFSANDYTTLDDTNYITNYFALDSGVSSTIEALKNGLAAEQ